MSIFSISRSKDVVKGISNLMEDNLATREKISPKSIPLTCE